MVFTARISSGKPVDMAATEMLASCKTHGVEPTPALHNNVLAALARHSSPEAVLSWLERMRASNVPLDRVACNIQLKALTAARDMSTAVALCAACLTPQYHKPRPQP